MSYLAILVAAFLFLFNLPPPSLVADSPTVYSVLQSYNLPVGILPKGVVKYDLDKSTGKVNAYFNKTCTVSLVGYHLKYKSRVSGYISQNNLKKMSGVQVKALLFWLNVDEAIRDGDNIKFKVGVKSVNFPIKSFLESPQCE